MKNVLRRGLTIGSLLAFGLGLTAFAQDDWYQTRESFYHAGHWRGHIFERVRDDVEHVQTTAFSGAHDEFRLARTRQDLDELQGKLAAGQYDEPQLDNVIHTLQRVVDSNKLSERDRDMLSDDVSRLRDYRDHHADWAHE
jgi:hypothetical protein